MTGSCPPDISTHQRRRREKMTSDAKEKHSSYSKRKDFIRAVIPPLLSILLFGLAMWLFFLPSLKAHIFNDRREMLAQLTQLCWDIMEDFELQVRYGQLTRKEAQARAIREIGSIRYGPELKAYFWINDMQGRMIMHPYRKDLEGKDISALTDPHGKHFVRQFLNVVKKSGQGFVDYLWQWQDDPNRIVPKLSHVRDFEPWGWVIGTGMYLDDVSAKVAQVTRRLDTVFLSIFVLISLLCFYNIRQTLAVENERDEAERALRDSESRFRRLAETAPFGLTLSDVEGGFDYINPKFTEMFGYTSEEMPDKKAWFQKAYPDPVYRAQVKEVWTKDIEDLRSKGNAMEQVFQVTCKDGSKKMIRFRNVAIAEQKHSLTYEDITAQEEARIRLLESERKFKLLYKKCRMEDQLYRSLIESSADAIIIYDLDGKTQYVSPTFTETFGWTEKEVLSRRIPFVPDSEETESLKMSNRLLREGTPCRNFETRRFTKNGNIVEVSISASRYNDYQGNPAGMLVIVRDITEKKRLEAQLQQAQKMEAIGTLAGGIAHDFNNLLMGIQGNASLMLLQVEEDHAFYEKLRNIEDQVQSGSKLTGQLLGYARQGRYEVKAINLNHIVEETAETFGRTKKEITLHLKLDENLCGIEADRTQIEQVLLNLCVNAWQAMPGGGDLFLKTRNVDYEEMKGEVYRAKQRKYVLLSVRDTGVGMDQEIVEKIFDPFFTTKEMGHGTGLGLASVYGIVKGHGGYIDVETKKGKGSTFKIYLPASSRSMELEKEGVDNRAQGVGTILLVDDEEAVAAIARELLEALGYKVLLARDGKSAVRTYKQKKDEIDLVLLDMVLPGMDGGEIFKVLKQLNPDVRVLLSSGYSLNGKAQEILNRGCNGFIQKPYRVNTLAKAIKEILGS
jgi:two-component system cell cycle sensor histidine kinase/response regulator CckA